MPEVNLFFALYRNLMVICQFITPILWGGKNGEGGIRTHGRRKPSEVFKTSAFDHSATSPMIEGSDQAGILSAPPIQGRRASGMTMLPSGCW